MRAFIEGELNSKIKRELLNNLKRIQIDHSGIRWQKEDQLHLTLIFLSNISQRQAQRAATILDRSSNHFQPFLASFNGLGCFKYRRKLKIIFAEIDQGREQLIKLQADLLKNLAEDNFHLEQRRFYPHLTLARIKNVDLSINQEIERSIKKIDLRVKFRLKTLNLTVSRLFKEGAKYGIIESVNLASKRKN